MHTPNPLHHKISAFWQNRPERRKVGDTLTAEVVDRNGKDVSDNVKFQWLADGLFIVGATDETLEVTEYMVGKKIKVTATAENGNKFESDETAPVVADFSFEAEIVDASGFQADGTALINDVLGVIYGASFGTPKAATWYVNGTVKETYVTGPSGQFELAQATDRGWIGEVYAIIENTDGEKATTNTITVTDVELPIEVSDIEILNDYETPTLSYNSQDASAVVTVTMSKAVEGDLYIYKESVSKYGKNNKTFKIDADDFTYTNPVVKASQLTAKKAIEEAGKVWSGAQGATGIHFQDSDGSTTYMLVVNDGDMDDAFTPVRGTTYKAVFDQEGVSTDDIGTTTRADVTVSDPFTAPYVVAPTSIGLTSRSNNGAPKITFYDEEEATLTWLGDKINKTAAAVGLNTITVYGETGSSKDKAKKIAQTGASTVSEGVLTGDVNLDNNSSYFWATVTTKKGIYGAGALTYETAIVEATERPFTTLQLVDDSTNPKDAVVSFKKLKTDGKVYILNHKAGESTDALKAFDADDTSTYVASAEVEKGDTKVTLSGALSSWADSKAAGGTYYYTPYFVPNNTEEFAAVPIESWDNTKRTVKDADKSNGLTVAQIPTSIAYDDDEAEDIVTSSAVTLDKETTISDTIVGKKIKAYDQFGDLVEGGQDAKTVTSCVAKNATLTTTEDANAQFEIVAGTGAVTINLYRDAAVDAGDGFAITILGSEVTLKNTTGALVNDAAGTGNFEVKLGSNKVATGKTSALGTAKVTFNKIDGALAASQVLAFYTGELEEGATAALEESNNGVNWTTAANGMLSVNTVGEKITENDTPATVAANTYYRIKVSAPGFANGYVTMTGSKTAAQTLTLKGTETLTLTTNTDSSCVFTIGSVKDQFGNAMADTTSDVAIAGNLVFANLTATPSVTTKKYTIASGTLTVTISGTNLSEADGNTIEVPLTSTNSKVPKVTYSDATTATIAWAAPAGA